MKIQFHVKFFIIILFALHNLNAQNIIQDTLTISFEKISEREFNAVVDIVIDQRGQHASFIGYYETNNYWIIPVDLMIQTEKPLSTVVRNMFTEQPSSARTHLKLLIDRFELIKNTNSLIYPNYKLNSFIQVYRSDDLEKNKFIGNLIYENTVGEKYFSDELEEGFKSVVSNWQNDFVHDMKIISNDSLLSQNSLLENFRVDTEEVRWTNLYGGLDYIYGLNDYLIDGEIFFSNREAKKWFYRNGYGIRYRDSKTFESIEFGLSVDYLHYRLNSQFIFKFKSQLFVGANNWKDYKTKEHEFYDAFIGDLSLSQSIVYNPLDKSSIIFGIGLSEDLTYIYSKDFRIQAGLLFHLGIKL